jgi:hypothetical protein
MRLRSAIVICFLAATVFAGYWFGWYAWLARHWLISSLSVYLLVGVGIHTLGALVVLRQLRQDDTHLGMLIAARARTMVRDTDHYRARISDLLMLPSSLAFWPVDVYLGIVMKRAQSAELGGEGASSVVDLSARISLVSRDAIFSVLTALSAVLMLLVAGLSERTDRGVVFAATGIMAIIFLRHVRYAVSVDRLPVVLRRIYAHPFLAYALILTADCLALVVCDRLIMNSAPQFDPLDTARIAESWKGLFDFTQLLALFQQKDLGGMARLAIGGLFYFTLGKSILNFKDFAKDDADRLWRVRALLQLKRYPDALAEIRAVKQQTGDSELLSAAIHLGLDRIDRAVEKMQSAILRLDEKSSPDVILQLLAQLAAFQNVSPSIKRKIIEVGLVSQAKDSALQAVITGLCNADDTDTAERQALFDRLGDGYPLSRARLLLMADDHAGASQLLAAAVPGDEIDEAMRLFILLQAKILGRTTVDQDKAVVEDWCSTSLPIVLDLVKHTNSLSDLSLLHGQIGIVDLQIEALVRMPVAMLKSCTSDIEMRLADSPLFMGDIALRKAMLERLRARFQ